MYVPPNHREFLRKRFDIVGETSLTDAQKEIVTKYGAWMQALSQRQIYPVTKEQARFVRMCFGQEQPSTDFELAWSRYCLDQRYSRLASLSTSLGTKMTYAECRAGMEKLARKGSLLAVAWLKKEGGWSESPGEKQSHYASSTFFASGAKILDSKPLPGSFGIKNEGGLG